MRILFLVTAIAIAAQADDAVTRGKAQFTKTCSFCHGPEATGGAEGPNLIRSSVVRHDKDGDLIGNVIREGRPQKGMPPVPLSDAQIADVVAYLHYRLTETDIRSPRRPQGYAASILLTGDANKGRIYFTKHCSSCHSTDGDLKGIASRLEPVELQTHFLYPENVLSTVRLSDGTEGTLLYRDEFTLAMRDREGRYHSWPADQVQAEIHDPVAAHKKLLGEYTGSDIHDIFAFLETLK